MGSNYDSFLCVEEKLTHVVSVRFFVFLVSKMSLKIHHKIIFSILGKKHISSLEIGLTAASFGLHECLSGDFCFNKLPF